MNQSKFSDYSTITALMMCIALSLSLINCSNSTDSGMDNIEDDDAPIEVSGVLTLENNGASAYVAVSLTGSGISAELETENPEINLEIGRRVTIINDAGASLHPLVLRNSDSETLLGQRSDRGSFSEDDGVDAIFEGNSITFTVTEQLAAELNDYICSFHPGMNGSITIAE
ncbi:MAG: hypothetical protein JJU46_01320 [Balneolaceae bacterium]|nr:hypothetical protein [Balneolaceae bacterium]MCH8550117.1 hypothetical protein [Balneolaceae bacterium]